jgi:metallo-beta-lactamase family protein
MTMKISFHGADHNVTGSCHLIECHGHKLLIDCGLYQGERELTEENCGPFGFEPAAIDFLLLTHAHLDHCGRIPLLIKRGFKGEIITTTASRELTRLILLDSGHIQEADAEYQARKVARSSHYHKRQSVKPLYTVLDALNSMDFFGRVADYTIPLDIAPGIRVTFLDAGHILGSASIYLELVEEGKRRTILFSGDLGYNGRVILRDPSIPPHAQVVVMETTYGDRVHKPLQPSIEELYGAIKDTFRRGGNVVIPTFALERAQEILYFLHEGVANGRLPTSMQVFLDSPMAISATEIFERHPECYDAEMSKLLSDNQDPFSLPGLHLTRETSQSIAVNNIRGGAVIMAGSGMCTGGRVRHHLKHNLWRPESSVIFVGFAAQGTLARKIVDGVASVHIYHEEIPVRAKIFTIGGFSAHADQAELLAWHRQTGHPERTFLVHGDKEAMQHFAAKLSGTHVEMPKLHQEFTL